MFGYSGRSIPGHDPSMKTTGGLMFYHFDGMSSVSELTDRHGDVIQHYRHDAFGALFTGITAPYNTNSYTGHQYDQDVGLIDMRARWYDASIGRFLQEDTYPGTLDNPLSQNRYAYVMNNPMNFWDPTGRVPEEVRNRENFRVTVHNGDEQERWYYTFQQYSTSTQESEKTRSVQEREIIYSWWETTIHSWEYEKQLRAIIDANGDLNPVTRDPVAVHYEEVSRSGITETYSAKDLMHDNFEELIKQGVLRGHRTVLFSGTISMRNGEFLSRHLHVGDELQLDRLYDELIWGNSNQSVVYQAPGYLQNFDHTSDNQSGVGGFHESWNNVVSVTNTFFEGVTDALISNITLTAFDHYLPGPSAEDSEIAYYSGRVVGDGLSMLVGAFEMVAGAKLALGGSALTIASPATGPGVIILAPAGIATTVAGASVAAHGTGVLVTSASGIQNNTNNLIQAFSGSSQGKGNVPTNINVVKDRHLKNKGIDAHELKKDFVGSKNMSKYDIYVDKDTGMLWIFRKGGKGEGIPTYEFIK